jgi:16S rRNA (adenine1518-N6/adenine1519-N6)-dimethyltransferase
MQPLSEIKAILSERGLRPRHRFGQNFLIEPMHLRRIVDAAGITPGDTILEVGPGTGTLTEELLARGARIVASEIDRDLAALLRDRFAASIELVEGDVLSTKRMIAPAVLGAIGQGAFKLVANLPYQIASPLLAILAGDPRCRGCFVTVQREVADRLGAGPDTPDYGPLSVVVQSRFSISRLADLPPGCFWPPPKVTSAMVAMEPRPEPSVPLEHLDAFGRFVQSIFGKRRKQLGAIVGRSVPLPEGIDAACRPESLSIDDWVRLWTARPRESTEG